jgi:hypothetical protein
MIYSVHYFNVLLYNLRNNMEVFGLVVPNSRARRENSKNTSFKNMII